MARRLLTIALAWVIAGAAAAPAAASPRTSYERAVARASQLRLDGPRPSPLSQMRRAMSACEAVARRYPASGYADNALFEAARVALAAHRVYGSEVDREHGLRLLTWLLGQYPSSSLKPKAQVMLRTARAKAAARPASPARAAAKSPAAPAALADAAASLVSHAAEASPAPVRPAAVPPPAAAPTHAAATAPLPLATLRGVRRSTVGTAIRLTLEFDGEVAAAPQEIDGPRRVFFDFDRTEAVDGLRDAVLTFEGPAARRARIGRPKPTTTRVVVDLDGVASYSHFALYNPYRVMIDLVPVDATPAPLTARKLAASPLAPRPGVTGRDLARDLRAAERIVPRPLPHPLADRPVAVAAVPSPRPVAAAFLPPPLQGRTLRRSLSRLTPLPAVASGVTAAAVEARVAADLARRQRPIATREPAPATVPAPVAPVENGAGGFSIARQLGLGVSRIVIDPGHGGHDPGAMGHRTTEAEVVLDVALRLEKLLNAEGTFDVVLTRRSNVYIALEERTAVANRAGADLFLSIHANSSRNRRATGVETYYLNFASNPEAEAVAARENATAARSMHQLPEMVRAIALNNKLDESRDFARLVQDAMVTRLKPHNGQLRDLGVKQAPFVVLIGATMPSVLAEIAFISNESEGSLLRQGQYRQRVAEALFDSVKRYQRALKQVGTVASQQ